ncbi:MAG: ATP phosphoribosyltransferase regulatory subunit [Gammaproteobacteria bacterium]|nr:ATP phosphoribosyltransferase regulatory subunit [Gammaproteobacteria bacterium]
MSRQDRWLLPEGIEELLPLEAEQLEALRRKLLDLFRSWGYELVMPPLVEYIESLLTGTSNDLDLKTFKITDQLTGRLMGVRADMTPQAARIDAHRLKRTTPVRLCYLGTVLHTLPDGFARSRNPLQVGAELYGHEGIESDLEVLILMLETLTTAGVTGICLDLGHVGIYRGLVREANLKQEQEKTLFDALQRKAGSEIEELLSSFTLTKTYRQRFALLAELNGGAEVLEDGRSVLRGASAETLNALEGLCNLAQAVQRRLPETSLHFDLAELRGYHYHTGAVFAAYVAGHGQAVAQGGRYDDIGAVFGRARPATGFSADLKTLVNLSSAKAATTPGAIFAPWVEDAALEAVIRSLRTQGERVLCALPGQEGGAREMGCERELELTQGSWVVTRRKGAG